MEIKTYTLSELATIKYGKNQKKVASDIGAIPILLGNIFSVEIYVLSSSSETDVFPLT